MDIQWYPGHMTKARRQMQEDLKKVDLIIELTDARVPQSSRNPDIASLGQGKARLMVMGKADLADEAANRVWKAYFQSQGMTVFCADARQRSVWKQLQPLVREACREKLERDRKRGIRNRTLRAMVAGIPNVGKSTLINSCAGRSSAKTGNKPGVTKGNQWIHLGNDLDLLDTPGILWPKFDDPEVGVRLAVIGSVNDTLLDTASLSLELIRFLQKQYPSALTERYGIPDGADNILTEIAAVRGCLKKGGEPDPDRASQLLLDDFRSGRLGRITLEMPPAGETS